MIITPDGTVKEEERYLVTIIEHIINIKYYINYMTVDDSTEMKLFQFDIVIIWYKFYIRHCIYWLVTS